MHDCLDSCFWHTKAEHLTGKVWKSKTVHLLVTKKQGGKRVPAQVDFYLPPLQLHPAPIPPQAYRMVPPTFREGPFSSVALPRQLSLEMPSYTHPGFALLISQVSLSQVRLTIIVKHQSLTGVRGDKNRIDSLSLVTKGQQNLARNTDGWCSNKGN